MVACPGPPVTAAHSRPTDLGWRVCLSSRAHGFRGARDLPGPARAAAVCFLLDLVRGALLRFVQTGLCRASWPAGLPEASMCVCELTTAPRTAAQPPRPALLSPGTRRPRASCGLVAGRQGEPPALLSFRSPCGPVTTVPGGDAQTSRGPPPVHLFPATYPVRSPPPWRSPQLGFLARKERYFCLPIRYRSSAVYVAPSPCGSGARWHGKT